MTRDQKVFGAGMVVGAACAILLFFPIETPPEPAPTIIIRTEPIECHWDVSAKEVKIRQMRPDKEDKNGNSR